MDPAKNKPLLQEACAVMGIPIDPLDSARDLFNKVLCRRRVVHTPKRSRSSHSTIQTTDTLKEESFKRNEMQRLEACREFACDKDALLSEVDKRWEAARKMTLARYGDAIVFIEDSSANIDLIEQFTSNGFRLVVLDEVGMHFVRSGDATQEAPGCVQDDDTPSDSKKIDSASATTLPADQCKKDLLAAAAERRVNTLPHQPAASVPISKGESPVTQFVDWMLPKLDIDDILKMIAHVDGSRLEEYKARLTDRVHRKSAKTEALTTIGVCIFSGDHS